MVRISAIFIAVCMVLIAGSIGFVLYLRFGLTGAESVAGRRSASLTALAVYNAVAARTRDRAEVSDQIADLSRGSGDLARQVAEFGRRLGTMETKVEAVLDKALATAQPLAAEIEELSTLVKQLADSVAAHERGAGRASSGKRAPIAPACDLRHPVRPLAPTAAVPMPRSAPRRRLRRSPARSQPSTAWTRTAIIAAINSAIDGSKIDLYLQPIVTLPQRKVRYYEAMSRLQGRQRRAGRGRRFPQISPKPAG